MKLKFVRKLKPEASGMAFSEKISWPKAIVSVISQLFQGEQMGLEQVFDILTVKHMDALREQIQSLVDYVLNHSANFDNDRKD